MQGDRLEVQTAIQVDRGDDVPLHIRSATRTGEPRCADKYSLQGRGQTTSSLRGSRCRSWSRGSHPSAVLGLTLKQMTAVHCGRLVAGRGGRCELASRARKRQGTGCSEGLSLRRVGGVSLNSFHLEMRIAQQKVETLLSLRTRLSRSVNVERTVRALIVRDRKIKANQKCSSDRFCGVVGRRFRGAGWVL